MKRVLSRTLTLLVLLLWAAGIAAQDRPAEIRFYGDVLIGVEVGPEVESHTEKGWRVSHLFNGGSAGPSAADLPRGEQTGLRWYTASPDTSMADTALAAKEIHPWDLAHDIVDGKVPAPYGRLGCQNPYSVQPL